jgi:SAM-dependent methyltransferase
MVKNCKICDSSQQKTAYLGEIRGGDKKYQVSECEGCGVQQLEAGSQIDYEKGYRDMVGSDEMSRHLKAMNNYCQIDTRIMGKTVVDVGASDGFYLKSIGDFAKQAIGVEPNNNQRHELETTYPMFADLAACNERYKGKIDTVTAWHVIEHIDDPQPFMKEIYDLLSPEGVAILSTPNRNDILMTLMDSDFAPFFYRLWHPYYYDELSFSCLAEQTGFRVLDLGYGHSFGLSNTFGWLKEKQPVGKGRQLTPHQEETIDVMWKNYVEAYGFADTLYFVIDKQEIH